MRRAGLLGACVFCLGTTSCAAPDALAPRAAEAPTLASWREARRKLAALSKEAEGQGARTLKLALALREPLTGRTLEARGAVAIAPPDSLRMILLGPGGTTALDLWVRGERFRFAVPAIDLLKRGDASTPRAAMRGLPVDFLRWWLLRPASGRLLWHEVEPAGDRFMLRDGAAVIDLYAADSGALSARRTTWSGEGTGAKKLDEEVVEADRIGCGTVRYRQASTGLTVTVTCEGEETGRAPNPRAFADPDAPAEVDAAGGGAS
ncbi:hypothetical protein [Polyangium sp. 15x6]|uniref:hypothetical protein n=1 Tax=Polyangium sp. 15x6 TaxID=3042687 RepID=UPI00249B062F|nr:hypothetical protein [Polyangium sp. 15x6]MDI3285193.1 hypothetical protein [Polyangium sp. 15x6]